MKIIIIGGGASGMMAALTASEEKNNTVILLERQARLGRKLLATGNGRCNLTNEKLTPAAYHGQEPDFCSVALRQFPVEETLALFHSLGLLTLTEPSGRVYPLSDSANSVLDVLRLTLEQRRNVRLVTACEVTALGKEAGRFWLRTSEERVESDCVLVCAGGAAGGRLGGTESGYRLLEAFGHTRTPIYPALVQLCVREELVRALKGIRVQVAIAYENNRYSGELQFTDYGVSGPVIFDLSRQAAICGGTLELDFLPQLTQQALLRLLNDRCNALPSLPSQELLTGMLHNRLGRVLLKQCDISFTQPCNTLTQAQLTALTATAKHLALTLSGTMGLEQAQVTAGGIRTAEFDETTLESKLCGGLYAAGEVLDIDGDCGGYNLQWAWSSGRLAGKCRTNR